jgi:hypothetical protein
VPLTTTKREMKCIIIAMETQSQELIISELGFEISHPEVIT